jgi:acetyl-CoA C-acetyltransferase
MSLDPRTPVLVGIGVAEQRCDDPEEALEPFELMAVALETAADDAGSRRLLTEADSIRVPRGFWEYSDPGRLVAGRVGARRVRTVLAEIGILQQTLMSDALRAIARAEERVVLITGAEAKYRALRASIAGVELRDTPQTDVEPDVRLQPDDPLWDDIEWDRGLMMPVHFFTVIENALRFHQGLSLDAHRDEIAALWAGFSRVAAGNPHAWSRVPLSAEEIRDPSATNRMIAFPYTKLHNAQWNVDQAAGLILCSVETARTHGIPRDRWVFPLSATESNHVVPLSARTELHRCPGIATAGGRALELAERTVNDIGHVDLYSCFPAVVRVFAGELGLGFDRPLTVTGGMTFAGGPLNNYVLQATARMVEVLRADPGSTGLVTAISGYINKYGCSLWSTEPPANGFQVADLTAEVARNAQTRRLVAEYEGPATVVGYTVIYGGTDPVKGIAVCDLPDGTRTVADTDDPGLTSAMTTEEFCGRNVVVGAGGKLISAGGVSA